MITVFLRTVILYFSMIFAMRIMGKKQVGELQPSELVVSIAISDLASIPMQDMNQPLLSGLIPIITLTCLEVILSFVTLKSRPVRTALTGTPCILIRHGKICEDEMERLRYNLGDLTEELRTSGYPDIREIEYAILETTGTLNILPVSDKRPLTPADLNISVPQANLCVMVIADGKLLSDSLKHTGYNESWLRKQLEDNHIRRYEDVFYAAVCGKELLIQKRGTNT